MSEPGRPPSVAVAVVCICSAAHLERCLAGLRAQEAAPPFRVVVCHDPNLAGIDAVASRHPHVRVFANAGQRTPVELAAAALRACDEDVVLLTEDHCVPRRDWVRQMLAARAPGRAAVGGRVEIRSAASAVDWAFYFVDFFRYAAPVHEGPAPSLTVCNVAYEREHLHAVRDVWWNGFEETTAHAALRSRFGALWLEPDSEIVMQRKVSLRDALYERYAFGRLLGSKRVGAVSPGRRWLYAGLAPALPAVLLGRMVTKALRSTRLARAFLRSLVPLIAMIVCWSWGEWLGYITGRPARSLVVAPEVSAAG